MELIRRVKPTIEVGAIYKALLRSPMPDVFGGMSEGATQRLVKETKANEGVMFTAETQSHESDEHLLHGLRPELQKVIADATESTQSPWQITFGFMLGAASVALGYKISSRWKTYVNHPNLNIVVVAESGAGKSGPLDLMFQPIRQEQYEELKIYKQALREYKQSKPDERPLEKPRRKKYLTDDATIEAIKRDEVFNPNGLGVIKDEGVLDFVGSYKDKSTQAKDDHEFIKMCNCAPIESSRKGDDEDTVASDHSYLCVVGGTQPVNLPIMFGERRILNGMCARFLFIVPPQTKRDEQLEDKAVDLSAWVQAVGMMLRLPQTELAFTQDAKMLILDYRREMEKKMETSDSFVKTLYGKLQVHVLRLAMVLHYLCDNWKSDTITANEVQYTIDFMRYFEKEWLKAFDIIKQGKPKVKLGFYQAMHQDWDVLPEHCQQVKATPPSKAEFCRVHGIQPQNFNQYVLTAKY